MNKFDQNIKEKLIQNQEPPIDAWKNIESILDANQTKKRTLIPLYFWLSSTAACLVIGSIVYLFSNDPEPTHFSKSKSILVHKKNKTRSITNQDTQVKIESPDSDIQVINNVENYVNNLSINNKTTRPYIDINRDLIHYLNQFDWTNKTEFNQYNFNQHEDSQLQKEVVLSTSKKEIDLEELLKKEDKEKEKESIKAKIEAPKFAVSTYVSPTVLAQNKSFLSETFNSHEIVNNVEIAYGAKVAYQVNDKLNIRSGIGQYSINQSTKNLATTVPTSANGFGIVTLNETTKNNHEHITYSSPIAIISNSNAYPETLLLDENNTMNQEISFVEIPLEIEYKIAKTKKFNFNIIAGASYMLLTKNNIFIDNQQFNRLDIGKANNLNKNSYSLNSSVKLEYNLNKKAGLNLEPNYKYLVNPTKNSNKTNNSLIGLNLGISYKF